MGFSVPSTARATRLAIVLSLGGLALSIAACGGGSSAAPGKPSAQILLSAYHHTVAAGSAHVSFSETVSGGATGAQAITVTGAGVTDLDAATSDLTLAIPSIGNVQILLVAGEMYLKLPAALRSEIPGGKPWVELDLNAIARAKLGASLSQLTGTAQNPTDALGYLRAVSAKGVSEVGTASTDGVPTIEYRADVDLTKASSADPALKSAVANLEKRIGTSTLPVSVWIDHEDRIRQLSYQLSVTGASAVSGATGSRSKVASTITLGNYGTAVAVSAPPAGDVVNLSSVALGSTAT